MKRKSVITALALAMVLGIGATAYAATTDNTNTTGQRLGLGRITSMRGYDYIENILKSNFGLTDTDLSNALNSGKTLYDLAVEKGMTQDQLKTALLEERSKAIDAAASKGTITKEEADRLKSNLSINMQSCTGNFGQRQGQGAGQGQGQGRGRMGNAQGRGCLVTPSNTVK